MEKRAIIITLYRPEGFSCKEIERDAGTVLILVDNTPGADLGLPEGDGVVYLAQRANLGIARAQNIGIAKARELGCSYLTFFDQDSRPEPGLVGRLVDDFRRLRERGVSVAAVGPMVVNQATGSAYKSRGADVGDGLRETETIISSGMTTDIATLDRVGGMEEGLFIDLVDHEWCWRARAKGLRVFMSTSAVLPHSVGRESRSFLGFPIIVSAPIRYYYSYRNALIMMRRRYVPLTWKAKSLVRRTFALAHIALCGAYRGHRREIYRNIFRGLNDATHYGK